MGMTLIGLKPSNNIGRVIHFSNWVWQPLVEYLEKSYYDNIQNFPNLRFNSGEISEQDAQGLAYALDITHAGEWANTLSEYLNKLPHGPCFGCFGHGTKKDGILGATREACIVCKGSRTSPQYITQYYFLAGHVYHLREFLKYCGGCSLN